MPRRARRMTPEDIAAQEAEGSEASGRNWRRMTDEEIAERDARRAQEQQPRERPTIGTRVEGTPYDVLVDNAQRVLEQAVSAYQALRPIIEPYSNRRVPVDASVYVQLMRGTWRGALTGNTPGGSRFSIQAGTNNSRLWGALFDTSDLSRRALEGIPRSLASVFGKGIGRVTAIADGRLPRSSDDYDPDGGPRLPRNMRRTAVPFSLHQWFDALGVTELVEAWRSIVRDAGIDVPIADNDPAARRIRKKPARRARPMTEGERAVARAAGPAVPQSNVAAAADAVGDKVADAYDSARTLPVIWILGAIVALLIASRNSP